MTRQKGYLLATASGVAVAVAAGGAQAADMPMPMKAPPPAPVVVAPSWAGWYVGLNAGASWQRMDADPVSGYTGSVVNGGAPTSERYTTFIGGGQIGYNWQTGIYVYGLEGDFSGLSNGHSNISGPGSTDGDNAGVSSKMSWLSTIRGRVGVTYQNDTLLYATGGLAIGHVKNSFNFGDEGALPFVNLKSVSKTRTGWTVGGGIEHMFTAHWIVGVEAMWVDLGKSSFTDSLPGQSVKTTTFRNQAVIARLRASYKFLTFV